MMPLKHQTQRIDDLLASVTEEMLANHGQPFQDKSVWVERILLEMVRPDPIQLRRVLPEAIHFAFHNHQLTPTQALRQLVQLVQVAARQQGRPFNGVLELLPDVDDESDVEINGRMSPEEQLLRDLVNLALEVLGESIPILSPALGFRRDVAMVTVSVIECVKGNKLNIQPYLVTSTRELRRLSDEQLIPINGQEVALKVIPEGYKFLMQWHYSDIVPFLDGETIDPAALFNTVHSLFTTYVDFRSEVESRILTLWTIGTYYWRRSWAWKTFSPAAASRSRCAGQTRSCPCFRLTSTARPCDICCTC